MDVDFLLSKLSAAGIIGKVDDGNATPPHTENKPPEVIPAANVPEPVVPAPPVKHTVIAKKPNIKPPREKAAKKSSKKKEKENDDDSDEEDMIKESDIEKFPDLTEFNTAKLKP